MKYKNTINNLAKFLMLFAATIDLLLLIGPHISNP